MHLDSEDFLVSNLLLPLGSLVYLLFCVSKWGWGYDKYLAEANHGTGLKMPEAKWVKIYFRYILPVLILVILICICSTVLLSRYGSFYEAGEKAQKEKADSMENVISDMGVIMSAKEK